jgi:hypothetical protein
MCHCNRLAVITTMHGCEDNDAQQQQQQVVGMTMMGMGSGDDNPGNFATFFYIPSFPLRV